MRLTPAIAAPLVTAMALAPLTRAAETTWTVTAGGQGHSVVDPANSKPGMDLVIAEAKTWLTANPSDTLNLYFPAGEYHFYHPGAVAMNFLWFNVGTLVVRGDGMSSTTLVFHQPDQQGIQIQGTAPLHCRNITVEGMHLTRDDEVGLHGVYTSQGSVTEVDVGYVKIQVDAGYPHPAALSGAVWPGVLNHHMVLMPFCGDPLNPETDFITTYIRVDPLQVTDEGGGICRFVLVNDGSSMMNRWINVPIIWPFGQRVAVQAKLGEPTLRFHYTDACTARDLRFTRYSLNPFLISGASNSCVVERVRVERFPPINGKAPYFGGPGGGCMTNAQYTGHIIRDCSFIGTADDGIGVFSFYDSPVSANWLLEGNYVANCGRAFIIESSSSGTLRNNRVFRGDGGAITMGNIRNGATTTDSLTHWIIEDNVFDQMRGDPCIDIVGQQFIGTHDNITFARNTFIQAPKSWPVFEINYCNRVFLEDNVIQGFSTEEAMGYSPETGSRAMVYISKGLDVRGAGNTMNALTDRPMIGLNVGVAEVGWSYYASEASSGTYALFYSIGAEDGYIRETNEDSGAGGTVYAGINSSSGLRVGDDGSDRQLRAVVSFDTSSIPDEAEVLIAALQVNFGSTYIGNPFDTHGACLVDMKGGNGFNSNPALESADFQAPADATAIVTLTNPGATGRCIRAELGPTGRALVNKTGRTQFRIYFALDDNDNVTEDRVGLYPGEYATPHLRPQLTVCHTNPAVPVVLSAFALE